jgi:type II secretory pathway pseudopilin PulG
VHSNRDALQFFAQGARYEQSRYPVDLTEGIDARFPHVPKIKNAVSVVALSAILHAEANDGKQAANDVLIALAMARSLEAEPALLSQLVRAASVSTAVAALEQTVNRTALPGESLSELLRILRKMQDYDARGEGFNRGLAAERATSMALLDAPQKLLQALAAPGVGISAGQRHQTVARLEQGANLKEEQQYFEKTFQKLMAARKEAFPDRLKADDLIRQRVTEAADKKLAIIGVLLPGLAGRTASEAECVAHLRLGLTALALEQFRAAHDSRYPAALSELTPDYLTATPVDPFNGQLLRYCKKDAGYQVYSIGPDLKDDSGERMNAKDGDIVFAVVTPAKSDRIR